MEGSVQTGKSRKVDLVSLGMVSQDIPRQPSLVICQGHTLITIPETVLGGRILQRKLNEEIGSGDHTLMTASRCLGRGWRDITGI